MSGHTPEPWRAMSSGQTIRIDATIESESGQVSFGFIGEAVTDLIERHGFVAQDGRWKALKARAWSKATRMPIDQVDGEPRADEIIAQRDRLAAALRPFAAAADVLDFYVHEACPLEVSYPHDHVRMDDCGPGRVTLTREDFSEARAALAELDKEKS